VNGGSSRLAAGVALSGTHAAAFAAGAHPLWSVDPQGPGRTLAMKLANHAGLNYRAHAAETGQEGIGTMRTTLVAKSA
jgi:hypothetical protein